MGIDVFGRGTYAGGQLNSYVAAAAALREGARLFGVIYRLMYGRGTVRNSLSDSDDTADD